MSGYFLGLPIGLYLIGWIIEFVRYWRAKPAVPVWGGGLVAVGWGAHTFLLAFSLWQQGFHLATELSGVAWAAMIVNYAVHRKWRNAVFGFIFPPFAVALLLSTTLVSADVERIAEGMALAPAIWRGGLITHIVSILAGNVLFAMACLFSIVYLYQEHQIKAKLIRLVVSRLPSLNALDSLNHRAIALGFFFLSLGILLGLGLTSLEGVERRPMAWRLILPSLTWAVYAIFLLERAFRGKRGRFTAIWSIAGFAVVMTALVVEISFLAART